MMEFLYFPENKLEYIPAVISCLLFFIGAVAVLYAFKKASKKELEQLEQQAHVHRKNESQSSRKSLN